MLDVTKSWIAGLILRTKSEDGHGMAGRVDSSRQDVLWSGFRAPAHAETTLTAENRAVSGLIVYFLVAARVLTSSSASVKRLFSRPIASALDFWMRSPNSLMLATACS
jgi:hypothetical protein